MLQSEAIHYPGAERQKLRLIPLLPAAIFTGSALTLGMRLFEVAAPHQMSLPASKVWNETV